MGIAALALAGCGDDGSSGTADKISDAVTKPTDTSKNAKTGGVLRSFVTGDENTLDPLGSSRGAGFGGPSVPAYSRVLREPLVPEGKERVIAGDLAESWELADGGLKLTVKLRGDAKWDARAPTNSRIVNAQDVVYSLERFFAKSPYGSQLSYKIDPTSPVESTTVVDSRTVVYKMAFPWAPLMQTLAHGNHLILPVEAEDKFNAAREIRGSGPWLLDKYTPSAVFEWRKNPNWYNKELPYLDGYDQPILPEYAARVAQFRAGNIDVFAANAPDVIALVKDVPSLQLFQGDMDTGITSVAFGSKQGNPFYDVRLRRAVSMSIDRELLAYTESGADLYEKAGIPFPLVTDSHLAASWGKDLWIDPFDTAKWGDSGQYWKHDVAAAKALVSAAGFPNGLDVELQLSNRAHSSPQQAAVLANMMSEAGIRLKINVVDYNTVFLPNIWVSGAVKGNYDGMTFGNSGGAQPHVASSIYITSHTKGSFTSSRRWDAESDRIDGLISQALKEFDSKKLASILADTQKALASHMSGVPYTYGAKPYTQVWPWIQNYGVFTNSVTTATAPWLNHWIDTSKKT